MIIVRINRKSLFSLLISIVILSIVSITSMYMLSKGYRKIEPNKVIEDYFKFLNDKNREGVFSTLSPMKRTPNLYFGFENLVYIKIIDIQEEKDQWFARSYIKSLNSKNLNLKVNDAKAYIVTYESKYLRDNIGLENSGKHKKRFILIRINSNWFIDGVSYDLI